MKNSIEHKNRTNCNPCQISNINNSMQNNRQQKPYKPCQSQKKKKAGKKRIVLFMSSVCTGYLKRLVGILRFAMAIMVTIMAVIVAVTVAAAAMIMSSHGLNSPYFLF